MDPSLAFAELLSRPDDEIHVEHAALLVAAHAREGLDVEAELAAIDAIADGCSGDDLAAVLAHLFDDLGFRGNADAYYDPTNSYLDHVVSSRRGIPITLSILTVAVGRRRGLDLVGVGMPGHFLVGSAGDPSLFVDPFGGGQVIDIDGAAALFHGLHGAEARFSLGMLEPVGPRAIVTRMLNNLVSIFAARRDQRSRLWAVQLRAMVPGASIEDRAEVAAALAAVGEFSEAGRWLEALSFEASEPVAAGYRHAAERLRSRLN